MLKSCLNTLKHAVGSMSWHGDPKVAHVAIWGPYNTCNNVTGRHATPYVTTGGITAGHGTCQDTGGGACDGSQGQ